MYTKKDEKKIYKTLYVNEKVIEQLKEEAKRLNVSANKLLIMMINYCLKNKEWVVSEKDI